MAVSNVQQLVPPWAAMAEASASSSTSCSLLGTVILIQTPAALAERAFLGTVYILVIFACV